ncbi:hypothetical protein [uncultured Lutibacter sp.]|uniref:hypothetical protein n=1 Tax=uncultured Lutibacter sp. TaxID=437739 RepID=UPI00260A6C6A|nr:hypothetical protein [uncultured Lutibacter sp.]
MKKIIGILVLTVVFTFSNTINAQQKQRMQKKANYSPEQMATLMTKKLTLHLNLDAKQQKAIQNLLTREASERKEMMEKMKERRANGERPTDAERFEFENKRLDKQIAHKNEMRKILSNDQFEKWEKVQAAKMRNGKKKMANAKSNRMKRDGNQKGNSRRGDGQKEFKNRI